MTTIGDYVPPEVMDAWDAENGGRFASINRPIGGATHDKELPVGKHPFQLYSLATPNGVKVTIMFEELLALGFTDAEYDAWLIRIEQGDQFGSGFVGVNPNSKFSSDGLFDQNANVSLSLGRFCFILQKNLTRFCQPMPRHGPNVCRGCFGR